MGVWLLLSCHIGVAAAIVMLHKVLGVLLLCYVGVAAASVMLRGCLAVVVMLHGCCGCCRHATQGVTGAVITPRGSCPHYALLLSLPLIVGPGGPLRERQPYMSARRQYLIAKEEVSKEKKQKRLSMVVRLNF